MSNNLLELLKEYLSGDVVSNLAALIGESPKNTELALHTALPSLLTGLANKSADGNTIGNLFNLITQGNHDGGLLSNLGALSRGGDETSKLISDGGALLTNLFGDKASAITDLVANSSGISKNSSSSLLGFITPVALGLLGKKLKLGNIQGSAGLAGFLSGQSETLKAFIPAGLTGLLSGDTLESAIDKIDEGTVNASVAAPVITAVSSSFDKAVDLLDSDVPAIKTPEKTVSISETLGNIVDKVEDVAEESLSSVKQVAENIGESASEFSSQAVAEGKDFAQSAANAFEEGAGESKKFLPWLLMLAALALAWGLLRSCGAPTEKAPESTATKPTTTPVAPPPAQVEAPAPTAPEPAKVEAPVVDQATSNFFEKTLSTGYAIKAAKDGFINKLVSFIESSEPISKDLWFSMDGITFDTNKTTIKAESEAQLNDIAEILKAYPKVKIKVGGYTDDTGNARANKRLSNGRAIAVKKALVAKGIKSNVMDAEGYGSEFPVASNDTEEGRQKNRRIDVRVTEK